MTVTESQVNDVADDATDEAEDNSSGFGAGIFTDENGKMQLSDRLIALARGEAPEDNPADDERDDSPAIDDTDVIVDKAKKPDQKPAPAAATFSDDDKALAAKYEISDDELAEFGSPAALKQAVAVIERSVSKSAATTADGVDGKVVDASQSVDAVGDDQGKADDLDFDVEALVKVFEEDPETVKVIRTLGKVADDNRKLKETVARLEQREQERDQQYQTQEQQRVADEFHSKLDSMPSEFGLSKQNGKSVTLDQKFVDARIKVRDAAETIYQGYVAQGKPVPSVSEIIDQAIRIVNGVPRQSSDKRQALKAQSAMRRTTGSASAAASRQPPPVTDGSPASIARLPAVQKFWQQAQEENGSMR